MTGDTVEENLDLGRRRLGPATGVPALEAELLLAAAMKKSRSFLLAHPEATLSEVAQTRYHGWLHERTLGKPIAYILGYREFWSLPLAVNESVLVPRPETETLVEATLKVVPGDQPARILELGTGGGAIALALKKERPHWSVTAVDSSPTAIEVAEKNGAALDLVVDWRRASWFDGETRSDYTAVVSNPPYVASDDVHLEQGDVRWEPRNALDGGPDGLSALRTIIAESPNFLIYGGYLLLEHGYDQQDAVRALMSARGFQEIFTQPDLSGKPRVTLGRFANKEI